MLESAQLIHALDVCPSVFRSSWGLRQNPAHLQGLACLFLTNPYNYDSYEAHRSFSSFLLVFSLRDFFLLHPLAFGWIKLIRVSFGDLRSTGSCILQHLS